MHIVGSLLLSSFLDLMMLKIISQPTKKQPITNKPKKKTLIQILSNRVTLNCTYHQHVAHKAQTYQRVNPNFQLILSLQKCLLLLYPTKDKTQPDNGFCQDFWKFNETRVFWNEIVYYAVKISSGTIFYWMKDHSFYLS